MVSLQEILRRYSNASLYDMYNNRKLWHILCLNHSIWIALTSDVPYLTSKLAIFYESEEFLTVCRFKLWFWVVIYIAIMIGLTFTRLENQKTFQVIFTAARIVVLLLIFGTSLYSVISGVPLNSNLIRQDSTDFSLTSLFLCITMIQFTIGFQNIFQSAFNIYTRKRQTLRDWSSQPQ